MRLVQWAYGNFAGDRFNPMADMPITGGPACVESARYVVNAKAEVAQSRGVLNRSMLRALLEERFQLKVHRESRVVAVYAVAVGRGVA